MYENVKQELRINNDEFKTEIDNLIASAKDDLILAGIINDEKKPLIQRAIILYCKGTFGLDNPDSEKYMESYQKLKDHLSISDDYRIGEKI